MSSIQRITSKNNRTPDFAGLAARLAMDRIAIELDLLGAILADPEHLVPLARVEGVHCGRFDGDDTRTLWAATEIAIDAGLGRAAALSLCRAALRQAGLWDDAQPSRNLGAMRWSDSTLAALADSWPPSVVSVDRQIRRLTAIIARQDTASTAYEVALQALKGEAA